MGSSNNFNLGGGDSQADKKYEEEARAKLASMGNRKAISSADFEQDDGKSAEMADRFRAL